MLIFIADAVLQCDRTCQRYSEPYIRLTIQINFYSPKTSEFDLSFVILCVAECGGLAGGEKVADHASE